MCSRSSQTGLTLIEMLVAITVLSLVMVLGWRGLDSITRTRERLNIELEQTRRLQLAFAQLENDCRHALSPTQLGGILPIVIDGQQITVARGITQDAGPASMQLVRYRVLDGVLTRDTSPATRSCIELERFRLVLADRQAQASEVRLLTGVSRLTVRIWDGRGWLNVGDAAFNQRVNFNNTNNRSDWGGVEVALTIDQDPAPVSKIFLLGSV